MAWLLHAQPYDETLPGIVNLYFSDVGFVTSPVESPANTYWDRRIEVPLSFTRSLFSGADSSGQSDVAIGQVVLANSDGALDFLSDYEWDGRFIELKYTEVENPILSDFYVAFSGTAERLVLGDDVALELRDLQILFDEPYQPLKFLGTGGVEGPSEYKDRRKPRLLGVARQFTPLLLNEPASIWCYSDGPVGGPTLVADAGVPLTFYADFASYALLEATVLIPPGQYGTCNALGLLRLESPLNGILTIDAEGVKLSGSVLKKFADMAVHIVDAATTLGSGDFATGTVAALNAVCPQTLRLWYDGASELTVKAALDILAETVGCYYGFDLSRKIVLGRMEGPAGSEAFAYVERDLLELKVLGVDRRLKSQTVKWGKRLRVLSEDDLAGAVVDPEKSAMITEWRQEKYEDSAVATASLLAREETLESCFDVQANALTEAQRLVDLHGPKRQAYSATVEFEANLEPGLTVKLTDSRYGLAAGKLFLVLKLEQNAAEGESTMELWG